MPGAAVLSSLAHDATGADDVDELARKLSDPRVALSERLKIVASAEARLSFSSVLAFFEKTLRQHLCEKGFPGFPAYLTFYEICKKGDRLDALWSFVRSALVFEPTNMDLYMQLLQLEVKLCLSGAAARSLRRMGCIEPGIYANRLVIDLQIEIMSTGRHAVGDRNRRGLRAATARDVAGVEAAEAMERRILQVGSSQTDPGRIREMVKLARTIDRPDLAIDVLQRHRGSPLGRARDYWEMVKALQKSGAALPEGYYPFSIHLESVNACNAACVMCPVSSTARRRKRMAGDLVDKVIDEIRTFPFRPKVGLHGVGEPLLHKDLAARVAKFSKAGIHAYFSTNGQLMTERKAAELLEAGLRAVIFSLETMDAPVFEATRINLSFDVVLSNIKNFLKLRARTGAKTDVQITLVRAPEAEDRVLADIEMIRGMLTPDDRLHLIPRHNFTGGYAEGEATDAPCGNPFVQLNMTSDGLITACCLDSEQVFVAGDFNKQSMLEIYNGPAFQDLRRKHIEGRRREVEVCRECTAPESWARQATLPGTAVG